MYDAIDDPYTYENSTVLINLIDLHDQGELDDFEAEISNARAAEPLPDSCSFVRRGLLIAYERRLCARSGRSTRVPIFTVRQ
jgi:hypothetical protein